MKKLDKTNVMRILEQNKIRYTSHYYGDTDAVNALEVAQALNQDSNRVFKTLVTTGKPYEYFVFVIPAGCELDLKKAAKSVGAKNIEMLKMKDLMPLTGYVHGGCSPIGMKKQFTTVFHQTAAEYETIIFSGGKIGYQVELSYKDISDMFNFGIADIIKSSFSQ